MTPNEGEGVILSDWMAAGGGVLGAMGSVASGIMNYMSQQDVLAWQKAAQEKTWMREDTAVQRRTADLKAAGLNPVLAAGGAAQTGSPVTLRAPQLDLGNPGGQLVNAASAVQSIHQSAAQVDLLRQQAAKVAEERNGVKIDNISKAQVLPFKVSQEKANADYAVMTLADRVSKIQAETESAQWRSGLDQLEYVIMSAPTDSDITPTFAGKLAVAKKALLDAQKSATDQSIQYDKARTAALAYAVQEAGMDASFISKLGLPPKAVELASKAIQMLLQLAK